MSKNGENYEQCFFIFGFSAKFIIVWYSALQYLTMYV